MLKVVTPIRWPWFVMLTALALAGCVQPTHRAQDWEQVDPAERMIIQFSHVAGEDSPKGQAAQYFAQRVKILSQGRLEVQVFANSSLFDDASELDALQEGKVQILAPSFTKLAALVPQFQMLDLPFLFADEQSFTRVMSGSLGKQLLGILPSYGLQGLDVWPIGMTHFFSRERAIRTPGDLAGMILRVQSPVRSDLYRLLGVAPRVMGVSSLIRALEAKSVDGTEGVLSGLPSSRLASLFQHATVSAHSFEADLVVTSRRWWQALPEEQRLVVSQALAEATSWERENAPLLHWNTLERIRKSGTVAIYQLSPEERAEWLQVVEPLYASVGRAGDRGLLRDVVRAARPPGT